MDMRVINDILGSKGTAVLDAVKVVVAAISGVRILD